MSNRIPRTGVITNVNNGESGIFSSSGSDGAFSGSTLELKASTSDTYNRVRLEALADPDNAPISSIFLDVPTWGWANIQSQAEVRFRGLYINFFVNNNNRVQFNNNGSGPYALKAGGTTWGALSDSRLKQSLKEINNALDKVLSLHPVHFEFINQGENANPAGTRTGFIAQEFEQVLPGHTFEVEPMCDADKTLLGEGVKAKGIEADLVPYLVKAIQELKAELDTVKAELATLKG